MKHDVPVCEKMHMSGAEVLWSLECIYLLNLLPDLRGAVFFLLNSNDARSIGGTGRVSSFSTPIMHEVLVVHKMQTR